MMHTHTYIYIYISIRTHHSHNYLLLESGETIWLRKTYKKHFPTNFSRLFISLQISNPPRNCYPIIIPHALQPTLMVYLLHVSLTNHQWGPLPTPPRTNQPTKQPTPWGPQTKPKPPDRENNERQLDDCPVVTTNYYKYLIERGLHKCGQSPEITEMTK